jgi:hypothetical protein
LLSLLEIKLPVAHPEDPRLLWTYAFYDVQVPTKVGGRDIEELRKGATVLVAVQLSQRPDRIDEQAAIVAILVKQRPCPEPSDPSQ